MCLNLTIQKPDFYNIRPNHLEQSVYRIRGSPILCKPALMMLGAIKSHKMLQTK